MRVLVAPDKFAGTLTAPEAAAAIASGWRRHAPDDELDLVPMADGGPGFVDVLHESLGGRLLPVTVRGPLGSPVEATVLIDGETAYVESAQACGLHLTRKQDPEKATTYGVGQLLLAARDAEARRIVVGLGGSGTNDGGAGMLAALGATGDRPLDAGPLGLEGVTRVDIPREALAGIELVAASDVDNPLTGIFGATRIFGGQKGFDDAETPRWDAALEAFAAATDRFVASGKGAGAAGGLGFGLLLLGAERHPGVEVVAEAVGLLARARKADVVLTGEGSFDPQSGGGKAPAGVAAVAGEAVRPCVVLAGQVTVGAREMRALGVEAAYSLLDIVGEERAFAEPAAALADLAERVARTWSRD
ncbi:glycerate kinase [Nocardioides sp. DS6]|uniref:Glycerate kinase n=1 Tax=Nocardioides eburneus TaxID=3231482 RepID=A0ABV3STW2_9ACTN